MTIWISVLDAVPNAGELVKAKLVDETYELHYLEAFTTDGETWEQMISPVDSQMIPTPDYWKMPEVDYLSGHFQCKCAVETDS